MLGNGALLKMGDQLVEAEGLTSARWQVLGAVSMAAPPVTVPVVARTMGLSRQGVQKLAHGLVKDGLIQFRDNERDSRSPLLVVTPRRHEAYERASARRSKRAAGLSDGLSRTQIDSAQRILAELTSRLTEKE